MIACLRPHRLCGAARSRSPTLLHAHDDRPRSSTCTPPPSPPRPAGQPPGGDGVVLQLHRRGARLRHTHRVVVLRLLYSVHLATRRSVRRPPRSRVACQLTRLPDFILALWRAAALLPVIRILICKAPPRRPTASSRAPELLSLRQRSRARSPSLSLAMQQTSIYRDARRSRRPYYPSSIGCRRRDSCGRSANFHGDRRASTPADTTLLRERPDDPGLAPRSRATLYERSATPPRAPRPPRRPRPSIGPHPHVAAGDAAARPTSPTTTVARRPTRRRSSASPSRWPRRRRATRASSSRRASRA